MPAAHDFITRAPRDVMAWVALFDAAALPVLAETAAALEELREVEDEVDAHLLGQAIASDPLMT
ncbi:MAG TPA: histidine kinase, partial [Rubrivivax sp.]|nr:histidine kinase [Rubrivivax sp.]